MTDLLKVAWWVLLIQGALAIIFGLLVLFWPGMTVLVFVLLFATYAVVDGIFSAIGAVMHRRADPQWWLWLLLGLLSVVVGVLTFSWPQITALILLYLIAARALIAGVVQLVGALRARDQTSLWWIYLVSGILSILFGVVAFVWPGATALVLLWLIGLYALLIGAVLLVLAFQARRLSTAFEQPGTA